MAAFDVESLRQLADMPLPSDQVELARVWRHVGLDLVAAADEIERLTEALARIAARHANDNPRSFSGEIARAALAGQVPA